MIKKILTTTRELIEGAAVALGLLGGWCYLIEYLTR